MMYDEAIAFNSLETDFQTMRREAERSLERLLPRLEQEFDGQLGTHEWQVFQDRLYRHFDSLFNLLLKLYGNHYDFFYNLERVVALAAQSWFARSEELKQLDYERERNPYWFQSQEMVGAVCYVDLFADNLRKLSERIPYFKELGINYLHLMPLFRTPSGDNDGGYAVSDYRQVKLGLGTIDDLRQLADTLRAEGISLVLDFVFNHTSDEHRWAQRAASSDIDFQDFYYIYPDRLLPDQYDRTLREIFPDKRPGNFTYRRDMERWVWTTFNSFQWDLNYHNPRVFRAMANEMLFLANTGAEILRFDALAFIWKEMGTTCENLEQAHTLIQAFNALVRIAAPALLFKSEAIVHPDEVVKYIGGNECQLSYNPLLMALLWNSLATREVNLLQRSMGYRFKIPRDCAWANYVRCHDDIGWTFDDGDAAAFGIDGYNHRQFLNAFYNGRFPSSFARGLPFQENPATGDARVSGSLASLAGLESALQAGDETEIDLSIRRILLLHGVIFSIGGIPLIYLGDEIGYLNQYGYATEPAKADDSRWVHRPRIDWQKLERRNDPTTIEGRIFQPLKRMIDLRKQTVAFAGNQMDVMALNNPHVFSFVRSYAGHRAVVFANFSESWQSIPINELRLYGLSYRFHEAIGDRDVDLGGEQEFWLEPYQLAWLIAEPL